MKAEEIVVDVCGKYQVTPVLAEGSSVGYDIALPEDAGSILMPYNSQRIINTGIIFNLPEKCWMMLVPRSSSRKKNVRLANTIGVVDPSFRGPGDQLQVTLTRDSKKKQFLGTVTREQMLDASFMDDWYAARGCSVDTLLTTLLCPITNVYHIYVEEEDNFLIFSPGERFCQVLFLPYYKADLNALAFEDWPNTEDRGGHGSTGTHAIKS